MQVRLVVIRKYRPANNNEELTVLSATSNKEDYKDKQPKEETFIWKRLHTSLPAAKAAVTRLKKKYPDNNYYIGTITWSEDDGEE